MSNACSISGCDVYGPWRATATILPGVETELQLCDDHYEQVRTPLRGLSVSAPKVSYTSFAVRVTPKDTSFQALGLGNEGTNTMGGTTHQPTATATASTNSEGQPEATATATQPEESSTESQTPDEASTDSE